MILEMAVASVIAGTSVCSDHFENTSRFNPTELSDYQKCVYMVHDTHSGTVGNMLWVHTDGLYTYVPTKRLAGRSKTGMQEYVTEQVVANIVAAQNAEIAEVTQVIVQDTLDLIRSNAELIAEIEGLESDLGLAFDEIDTLEELVSFLNQFTVLVNDKIESLGEQLQNYDQDILDLSDALNDVDANSNVAEALRNAVELTEASIDANQKLLESLMHLIDIAYTQGVNSVTTTEAGLEIVDNNDGTYSVAVRSGYVLVADTTVLNDQPATVNPLVGISSSINGNEVTIGVATGYVLVLDTAVRNDQPAVVTPLTGISVAINGNSVTLSTEAGHRIVTDTMWNNRQTSNDQSVKQTLAGTLAGVGYDTATDSLFFRPGFGPSAQVDGITEIVRTFVAADPTDPFSSDDLFYTIRFVDINGNPTNLTVRNTGLTNQQTTFNELNDLYESGFTAGFAAGEAGVISILSSNGINYTVDPMTSVVTISLMDSFWNGRGVYTDTLATDRQEKLDDVFGTTTTSGTHTTRRSRANDGRMQPLGVERISTDIVGGELVFTHDMFEAGTNHHDLTGTFDVINEALKNRINDVITEIYNIGYDRGYEEGYRAGYDAGYQDGFDAARN